MAMNSGRRMEEKMVETKVWCLLMPLQSRSGSEEQKNSELFTHDSSFNVIINNVAIKSRKEAVVV